MHMMCIFIGKRCQVKSFIIDTRILISILGLNLNALKKITSGKASCVKGLHILEYLCIRLPMYFSACPEV